MLKDARGKEKHLIYRGTRIRNAVNFLPETMQATREMKHLNY